MLFHGSNKITLIGIVNLRVVFGTVTSFLNDPGCKLISFGHVPIEAVTRFNFLKHEIDWNWN